MKYCRHCGESMEENVVICPKCGCSTENVIQPSTKSAVSIGFIMKVGAIVWVVVSLMLSLIASTDYDEFSLEAFVFFLPSVNFPAAAIVYGIGEIIEILNHEKQKGNRKMRW